MTNMLLRSVALASFLALGACSDPDTPWVDAPRASPYGVRTLPDADDVSMYSRTQASPSNSATMFFFSVVLGVGGMLALSAVLFALHRRRAKLEESFNPNAPLRDGVSVVFGRVETEDGGPAVILRVHQRGREWQYKGQWNHAWEEVNRELHVRPFVLRTANGTTVRVEPPNPVQVQGEFKEIIRHSHTERTQVIELKNGADIHVYGALSGAAQQSTSMAYRAGGAMPVLSGSPRAPMVISTEKLGETARGRAKVHRNMGIALASWLLIAIFAVFPQYIALSLTGEVQQATVAQTRTWRTWVKPKNQPGYWQYHYALRATVEGATVEDEVSRTVYDAVMGGQLPRVPFVVSSISNDYHQFGNEAHTNEGRLVLSMLAMIIFAIVYPISSFSSRPWYHKKKVSQTGGGTIAQADARAVPKR